MGFESPAAHQFGAAESPHPIRSGGCEPAVTTAYRRADPIRQNRGFFLQKFCKSLGYVDFSRPLSQMGRLRSYKPPRPCSIHGRGTNQIGRLASRLVPAVSEDRSARGACQARVQRGVTWPLTRLEQHAPRTIHAPVVHRQNAAVTWRRKLGQHQPGAPFTAL